MTNSSRPPVIVTAALTGSIHVPSMSPYLPITAEQLRDHGVSAARAGATILHLHARRDVDGHPAFAPEDFRAYIPGILDEVQPVINISTGGSTAMTMEQRLAAATDLSPEIASLNLGTMNFVAAGIANRITEWRFEWEKPYVLRTYELPFINTFAQIEHTMHTLGEGHGVRFEYEAYDIGHLYTLEYFASKGIAKPPFFIQGVFGVLGGIGAHLDHLEHYVTTARRLFGDDAVLSAFGTGRHQMTIAHAIADLGGHVRVGLEDSVYLNRAELATSSAAQVTAIREHLESVGHTVATPAQAREILQLKGAEKTNLHE